MQTQIDVATSVANQLYNTVQTSVTNSFTAVWDMLSDLIPDNCILDDKHPAIITPVHPEDEQDNIVFGSKATFFGEINKLPSAVAVLSRDYKNIRPEYYLKAYITEDFRLHVSFFFSMFNCDNTIQEEIETRNYLHYPLSDGIVIDNWTVGLTRDSKYLEDRLKAISKEISCFLFNVY